MSIEKNLDLSDQRLPNLDLLRRQNKPIFIYGDGEYATIVEKYLNLKKIKICGRFVDEKYRNNKSTFTFKEASLKYGDIQIVIGIADHRLAYKNIYTKKYASMQPPVNFVLSPHYLDNINKKYILDNIENLEKTFSLLADQASKDALIAFLSTNTSGNDEYLFEFQTGDQYFPPFIEILKSEVFVDGGAYTGDTLKDFNKRSNGCFVKYYAFEPDPNNHRLLCKTVDEISHNNVLPYSAGLGKISGVQKFLLGDHSSTDSKISDAGGVEIKIKTIDESCQDATFIKLDIEGAEYEALQGSVYTIKKNRPKIAVCIYHDTSHIWSIAHLLHSIVPEYKFYIRQHRTICTELVLYAII